MARGSEMRFESRGARHLLILTPQTVRMTNGPDWESKIRLHQGGEVPSTQMESIWVARQCLKIPLLIERFGRVVQTIQYHRHEGEYLARFVTIAQGLGQQPLSQALLLVANRNAKPGEDGHRQDTLRQVVREFMGQLSEIHLACGQGVVAGDIVRGIKQDSGGG